MLFCLFENSEKDVILQNVAPLKKRHIFIYKKSRCYAKKVQKLQKLQIARQIYTSENGFGI